MQVKALLPHEKDDGGVQGHMVGSQEVRLLLDTSLHAGTRFGATWVGVGLRASMMPSREAVAAFYDAGTRGGGMWPCQSAGIMRRRAGVGAHILQAAQAAQ